MNASRSLAALTLMVAAWGVGSDALAAKIEHYLEVGALMARDTDPIFPGREIGTRPTLGGDLSLLAPTLAFTWSN